MLSVLCRFKLPDHLRLENLSGLAEAARMERKVSSFFPLVYWPSCSFHDQPRAHCELWNETVGMLHRCTVSKRVQE